MEKQKNTVLHLKYWIGILVFILILVVSSTWFHVEDLAEKLSFALTLSSAVLALLAIYITFNFNNLFANNVSRFLNINEDIQNTSSELQTALNRLDNKLDSVPKSIRTLHEKLDTTHSLLETSETYRAKSGEHLNLDNYIEWTDENGLPFVLSLNFRLMAFLYFTVETVRVNKEIRFEKFVEELSTEDFSYYIAFLHVLSALNIVSFYTNDDMTVKVNYLNPIFKNNSKHWVDNVIEHYKEDGHENAEIISEQIRSFIRIIES